MNDLVERFGDSIFPLALDVTDREADFAAILKVVDTESPPLCLLLGEFATRIIPQIYDKRLKEWAEWTDVSRAADGEPGA